MIFLALLLAVLNVSTALSVAGLGEGEQVLSVVKRDCELDFFPSNAFLRRRRKKALLRVNDRGGVWRMCILGLCRVYVCACVRVRARLQLTYVAMTILRKRSQFMIE